MIEFPIMEMREGDRVTVTEEWGTHHGTVNWTDRYQGWRVSVKLDSSETREFEASGPRAAKFWR